MPDNAALPCTVCCQLTTSGILTFTYQINFEKSSANTKLVNRCPMEPNSPRQDFKELSKTKQNKNKSQTSVRKRYTCKCQVFI